MTNPPTIMSPRCELNRRIAARARAGRKSGAARAEERIIQISISTSDAWGFTQEKWAPKTGGSGRSHDWKWRNGAALDVLGRIWEWYYS